MKYVFTILFLLLFSFVKCQNGGQFFENNIIKISYIEYKNGTYTFLVCNKQTCEARIRTKADQDPAVDILIQPDSCKIVLIEKPTILSFRAKAETFCISNPDMGWLELKTGLLLLSLTEKNQVLIKKNTIGPNVFIINSLLTTSYENVKYRQTITIYSFNGRKLFTDQKLIDEKYEKNISVYLEKGLNIVEVIIETNKTERFVYKYFK